jgi:hypothetical protein
MQAQTTSPETILIDEALQFAVVQAWDELAVENPLRAVRVEYLFEPGAILNHVTVWLVEPRGYQDRACDYWTRSSSHPEKWHWGKGIHSARLARALEFILENQERFRHAQDAALCRVIVVFTPGQEARAEAGVWAAALPFGDSEAHVAGRRVFGHGSG